jgi:peptidase A4-like protein
MGPATTSPAWAGYYVSTSHNAVSDVRANWHVPQIAAACPSLTTASTVFVGMDGVASGSYVEAVGTQTDCSGGHAIYGAWVEYGTTFISLSLKISPADHMFGDVKYNSGLKSTVFFIKDLTTGKSYSKTVSGAGYRASAEWIADDPYAGSVQYPLTDFGWVIFTNASATISGHTHSIGGFGLHTAVTMWNIAHTKVKTSVGSLSSGGASFKATWKSRGP